MDGSKMASFAAFSTAIVLIISLGIYTFYAFILIQTNKEMRTGTELSIFTQTFMATRAAAVAFFQKYDDQIEAFLNDKAGMSVMMRGDLVQMLDDIVFLAWLFNNGYVTLKGADEILSSQLEHVLNQAAVIIEKADPPASRYFAEHYPQITKVWVPDNDLSRKELRPTLP
ncbi:MAG: hypothetical protein ACYSRP_04670 [Planctomycetota bacterium]